jgi:nucleoside-diphosphate-sugar epimerase
MKVAVTGGSGFIGGFVVAALCEAGHSPRCLVRASSNTERIAHLPFERVVGDVLDADAVAALVLGCDGVIHLALSAGWDQMRTAAQLQALLRTSERGTRNVLEAAKAAGNKRVVFVSSVAVREPAQLSSPCCSTHRLARRPSTAAARRTACFERARQRSRWRARWATRR